MSVAIIAILAAMMFFAEWIEQQGITLQEVGRRIGTSSTAACRYANGGAIPRPETMRRIYIETGGAVDPNSFYDLPPLETPQSEHRPATPVMGDSRG